MTLISLNLINRICSAFAKKAYHMITECVAMHDQTENMIKLACFFTLHADNLAGFIMQSILGQTLNFLVYSVFMKYPYKGGIMSIRRVFK